MDTNNQLIFGFENFNLNNFKEYIKSLEVSQDREFNITREFKEEENGLKILNRNATNLFKNPSETQKVNSDIYAKLEVLAIRVKAAFELLEIEQELNPKININKKKILSEYEQSSKKLIGFLNIENANYEKDSKEAFQEIKNFDLKLGEVFKENNIEKMNKKFTEAIFWQSCNFESAAMKTEGEIKINGKTYKTLTIDEPLKPVFSESQLKRFQDGSYKTDSWYVKMNDFQKNIFERYKDKIINGEHVIPHKFFHIPGLRNAFKRTDRIIDENGNEISSASTFHSANLAAVGSGEDRKRIARENIEVLASQVENKRLICCGLVTPFGGIEKKIVEDISSASKEINREKKGIKIFSINIPINIARMIPGMRETSGLRDYMQEICIAISDKYHFTLDKSKSTTDMIKDIKFQWDNTKRYHVETNSFAGISDADKKIIDQIEKVTKLRHKSSTIKALFRKNVEIELNSEINVLRNMTNNHSELKEKFHSESVVFCKSGKDRTGAQIEASQAKVLAENLSNSINDKNNDINNVNKKDLKDAILENSLQSRHTISINGSVVGGNTPGSRGILNNPDMKIYFGRQFKNLLALRDNNANLTHVNLKSNFFRKNEEKFSNFAEKILHAAKDKINTLIGR